MANEYEVILRGETSGQVVNHVRYYRFPSTPTSAQITSFITNLGADFKQKFISVMSQASTYRDIYIRPNVPLAVGTGIVPADWPFSGQSTGDALPPFVTINVRLRTGVLAYPVKGLVQLPPPPEAQQAAGILIPAALAEYNTAVQHFLFTPSNGSGGVVTPLLYSRTYNQYNTITSASVINRLGTQAQRKYGRGS